MENVWDEPLKNVHIWYLNNLLYSYIVYNVQKRLSVFTEQKTKDHMCTRKTIYAYMVYNNNIIYIWSAYGSVFPYAAQQDNAGFRVNWIFYMTRWYAHNIAAHIFIIYDMEHRPRKSWHVTPSRYQPLNKKIIMIKGQMSSVLLSSRE